MSIKGYPAVFLALCTLEGVALNVYLLGKLIGLVL